MTNTFFISKNEATEAIIRYINFKTNGMLNPDDFMIGFLDDDEKNVDANLIQVFCEIE